MNTIVAVDLDNVIAKTDFKIRQIIGSISSVSLSQQDIQTWEYADALVAKGIAPSSAQKIIGESLIRFHDEECLEVEPLEGAVENIFKLHDAGLEIIIVTSRPGNCEALTKRWLTKFSIPDSWLRMERNKAAVCTKWSLLIDDAPHHATSVAEQGTSVYLFDYPWNRNIEYHPLIKRVINWQELTATVLQLHTS